MIVYTVAPRGPRGRPVVTQAARGDTIVYTDRRKRPLDAVSGHLCTLLCRERRREARAGAPWWRNSVHRSPKTAFRRRSGPFVYTVAARGSRGRPVGMQGDAIVYTDRRKRPFDAVPGHLCTLLCRERRREARAGGRWGLNSVHRWPKMVPRRRSGPFVYTVAARESRGRPVVAQ